MPRCKSGVGKSSDPEFWNSSWPLLATRLRASLGLRKKAPQMQDVTIATVGLCKNTKSQSTRDNTSFTSIRGRPLITGRSGASFHWWNLNLFFFFFQRPSDRIFRVRTVSYKSYIFFRLTSDQFFFFSGDAPGIFFQFAPPPWLVVDPLIEDFIVKYDSCSSLECKSIWDPHVSRHVYISYMKSELEKSEIRCPSGNWRQNKIWNSWGIYRLVIFLAFSPFLKLRKDIYLGS